MLIPTIKEDTTEAKEWLIRIGKKFFFPEK
jgi:hypothetical protein